jgi:hypothetical protein
MSEQRLYSEAEAVEIVQRAARLQESSADGGTYRPGVSVEELRRIAEDAGIDVRYLERALEGEGEEKTSRSLLNLVEETEFVLSGEIPAEDFDEVMEAFRRHGKVQVAQQIGRGMTGVLQRGSLFANFELFSKNGRTRLKLKATPFMAYFLGLHTPLILSLVLGVNLMARGLVVPGLLAMLGLLAVGGLVFWTIADAGKRKARAVAQDLKEAFGRLVR